MSMESAAPAAAAVVGAPIAGEPAVAGAVAGVWTVAGAHAASAPRAAAAHQCRMVMESAWEGEAVRLRGTIVRPPPPGKQSGAADAAGEVWRDRAACVARSSCFLSIRLLLVR